MVEIMYTDTTKKKIADLDITGEHIFSLENYQEDSPVFSIYYISPIGSDRLCGYFGKNVKKSEVINLVVANILEQKGFKNNIVQ